MFSLIRFSRSMQRLYCACLASGFVAVMGTPQASIGQSDHSDSGHRKYCENARATLNTRASRAEHRSALSNIQSCGSLVIPALIAEWAKSYDDTTALYLLGRISGQFRDRTLFNTVATVAADANRPRLQRLSAFIALVEYYNPKRIIGVTQRLDEPGLHPSAYVWFGAIYDGHTREGANPLNKTARDDVLALFTRIGQGDPDPLIRSVASYLATNLPLQ
jgi:hypothetical protein